MNKNEDNEKAKQIADRMMGLSNESSYNTPDEQRNNVRNVAEQAAISMAEWKDSKIRDILMKYTLWLNKRGFFAEDLQCDFGHQIDTFLEMSKTNKGDCIMKNEEEMLELLSKKMNEEMNNSINDEIFTSCWYNGHDIDSVEFRIKEMRRKLSREMDESYPGLNKMEYVESVDDAIKMGLTGKDLENAERYFNTRELYNRVNDIYMALPKLSGDDYRDMVNTYVDLERELIDKNFKKQ